MPDGQVLSRSIWSKALSEGSTDLLNIEMAKGGGQAITFKELI